MGKPITQSNSFINHFSHPHRLQLTPASSSPPCFACKLSGGNGRVYSCRPCNFFLHESCSKMKQVITHPSHPSHTLTLLVAPVYDGGFFNCDGCGVNGTGFSYQCSLCDFDIHALCAYKPLSIIHKSHPQHTLKLAFQSPYGANKGFSCDVCHQIGKNQWLYRCILCEFDAHVGCITQPQPHVLQHTTSAPTPHTHPVNHPQGVTRPVVRPNGPVGNPNRVNRPTNYSNRPSGTIRNPNRPISQNVALNGPRRHNNNLGYNDPNRPIRPVEVIGQGGQSSMQGSMDGSGYDGRAVNGQSFGQEPVDESGYDGSAMSEEFYGEVNVEVEYEVDVYEAGDDREVNVEEEEDVDGIRLEIVADVDGDGDVGGDSSSYSESDFGGSSDTRSQCNDLSEPTDMYPLSVRTKKGSSVGKKKNTNSNSSAARSKNIGLKETHNVLQGSKSPIQSLRGPQRRVQNVRNNAVRAAGGPPMQFNGPQGFNGGPQGFNGGPQGFNGPNGGPPNANDNGGNNDNYNEVDGADMYGEEENVGFDENCGDDYAVGDGDYCDFGEDGGDFGDDGYDHQDYDENDFESYSDFTGGSESMYDGNESCETMSDSQYSGSYNEPNNQYSPMVGGPGMNNQNMYGQASRPRNMTRSGRGGNVNVQRGTMGRRVQYQPNGGRPYRANGRPNGPYGGPNGPNGGPNGPNMLMNTMVQGLCQGLAMNMLNDGAGDGGGSSILGGLFGGDSSQI